MSTSPIYQQVSSATSEDSLPQDQPPKHRYSHSRGCISTALLAILVSGIAGFTTGICAANGANPVKLRVFQPSHPSSSTHSGGSSIEAIQDCGDTPAKARDKGCKYDVMLQMWIPAPCYDEQLSEAFLAKGRWKWYYDSEKQKEMPDEVMRLGEHEIAFMSDNYHRRHCAYSWEIQTRAMQEQWPLLDELLSFKHVHHCNTFLLSSPQTRHNSSIPVGVETHSGYGRCASYGKWLEEMPEE